MSKRRRDRITLKEAISDFCCKHHKKILLYSLVCTLLIGVISYLCRIKLGMLTVFIYPGAMFCFYIDLITGHGGRLPRFVTALIFFGVMILIFILGCLGYE